MIGASLDMDCKRQEMSSKGQKSMLPCHPDLSDCRRNELEEPPLERGDDHGGFFLA